MHGKSKIQEETLACLVNGSISRKTDTTTLYRYPSIIAEAGVNHEGDLDTAKRLVLEAAEGGADAIKFQTYKANTIASKFSPAYWDLKCEPTTSQHALFQKFDKFWKREFEQIKTWCDEAKIEFLSTPFDKESANFLNELMGVFKISSSDITNKPFVEYLADFGKPIILSTGASTLEEFRKLFDEAKLDQALATLVSLVLITSSNNNLFLTVKFVFLLIFDLFLPPE